MGSGVGGRDGGFDRMAAKILEDEDVDVDDGGEVTIISGAFGVPSGSTTLLALEVVVVVAIVVVVALSATSI